MRAKDRENNKQRTTKKETNKHKITALTRSVDGERDKRGAERDHIQELSCSK